MKNFCTVADSNFCDRVWALNHSLLKHSSNYTLHVLSLDKKAKEAFSLDSWKNSNIKVYYIEDLKNLDSHLKSCSRNPPSYEALNVGQSDAEKATKLQFLWSLSSYFSWFCLEKLNCEDIMFIDADIFFFGNWERIYDNLANTSVGIVEHRCPYSAANGKYNVGIVYFKNDFDGYKCLTWWRNCLLFTDNDYYSTHGMCGDQKYLELFEKLFDNVTILDDFIGHLAPWNYNFHEYKDNRIIWKDREQELTYCHFSNFNPDYENNTYVAARRHGFVNIDDKFVKRLYDEYFEVLRKVCD